MKICVLAAALVLAACAHSQEASQPEPTPGAVEDADTIALVRAALVQPCSGDCSKHQKECRRDATQCPEFAFDVDEGNGGMRRDQQRAHALLLHACAAGNGRACSLAEARSRTERDRDPVKAREWLREGCRKGTDAGAARACAELWRGQFLDNVTNDDRELALHRLRELCYRPQPDSEICRPLCDATHEEPACTYGVVSRP